MGKIWVEVGLVSGRGLRRTSALWKLQWFAVGWIDQRNKYCTKIDASGNGNPVWRTKFSTLVDTSECSFQDLALHVEVYSREPIFLREKLLGTTTVLLKEFLEKYVRDSQVLKPIEEVGSFQLRTKKNSNNPQGFIDISIRILAEREDPGSSYPGDDEEFKIDSSNGIILANRYGNPKANPPQPMLPRTERPESRPQTSEQYSRPVQHHASYADDDDEEEFKIDSRNGIILANRYGNPKTNPPQPMLPRTERPESRPQTSEQYSRPVQHYANYSDATAARPIFQPPRTPPPPPPPTNVGYIPTFLPRTDNMPPGYKNTPSSSGAAPGRVGGSGLGMGLGAGALAAGAVIFGDDFMSGFDIPGRLQDASNKNIN